MTTPSRPWARRTERPNNANRRSMPPLREQGAHRSGSDIWTHQADLQASSIHGGDVLFHSRPRGSRHGDHDVPEKIPEARFCRLGGLRAASAREPPLKIVPTTLTLPLRSRMPTRVTRSECVDHPSRSKPDRRDAREPRFVDHRVGCKVHGIDQRSELVDLMMKSSEVRERWAG